LWSRAGTRAGRIVRLVRLVRIFKLYNQYIRGLNAFEEEEKQSYETKVGRKLSGKRYNLLLS
jgi:hypothetical protein